MEFDPQVHRRRPIRLAGYDYSQAGAYFITICTHDRALLLQGERLKKVVRSAWHDMLARFPTITLDEFTIMPNHVHGIIFLQGAASSAPTLGRVVRAFKSISGIGANKILKRAGQPFWQRNYYDHIIRDEDELNALRQYIRDNPLRWQVDPDNPSNL